MTDGPSRWLTDPLHNVTLDLWNLEDLKEAEADGTPSMQDSIRVGAELFSSMPLDELLLRLSRFKVLSRIVVADDRVLDRDMPSVESAFKRTFPDAQFAWAFDGLISGKHGR